MEYPTKDLPPERPRQAPTRTGLCCTMFHVVLVAEDVFALHKMKPLSGYQLKQSMKRLDYHVVSHGTQQGSVQKMLLK